MIYNRNLFNVKVSHDLFHGLTGKARPPQRFRQGLNRVLDVLLFSCFMGVRVHYSVVSERKRGFLMPKMQKKPDSKQNLASEEGDEKLVI